MKKKWRKEVREGVKDGGREKGKEEVNKEDKGWCVGGGSEKKERKWYE